jgi:peptide/nickel transport system ATP-binding protein
LFQTLDADRQQRCIDVEPPREGAQAAEPGAAVVDHEVACHWARIRTVV